MPSVQAVVFDVYNTLVHNETELWEASFREIVATQRLAVDPSELGARWRVVDRGFRKRRVNLETMRQTLPFESYEAAWTQSFRTVFAQLSLQGDAAEAVRIVLRDMGARPLFPETLPLLERLNGAFPLAVLSNADRSYLDPLLDRYNLSGCFAYVLTSEEAREYKPLPGPFRRVAKRLGVAPGDVLHVGDMLQEDVWGAKLAGMRAVWLNPLSQAKDPRLPAPDYEVRSLAELPAIFGV
ncbi:MAG: HAD family hydrolase [Chloroflexi bacterium]|nr:HAD family hydrolase [Chloroflexota bacterium]